MAKPLHLDIIDACYPQPVCHHLTVEHPITVGEALAQTPFDWQNRAIGLYGRFVTLDTLLEQDSRLEIYQALWVDPKQARRARAATHKHS